MLDKVKKARGPWKKKKHGQKKAGGQQRAGGGGGNRLGMRRTVEEREGRGE